MLLSPLLNSKYISTFPSHFAFFKLWSGDQATSDNMLVTSERKDTVCLVPQTSNTQRLLYTFSNRVDLERTIPKVQKWLLLVQIIAFSSPWRLSFIFLLSMTMGGGGSSKDHSSETKMRNGSDNDETIIQVQDSCLPVTENLHHLEIHRDLNCLLYHFWVFGYVMNIQEWQECVPWTELVIWS